MFKFLGVAGRGAKRVTSLVRRVLRKNATLFNHPSHVAMTLCAFWALISSRCEQGHLVTGISGNHLPTQHALPARTVRPAASPL